MSRRTPSKRPRTPKIAAKAQRTAQDIVRSSRNSRKRSVGAGSTESPTEPKQEPLIIENPAKALEDDFKPWMAVNESKNVLDFYSAAANVRAYQAMLLEMAQANMQFAFEFAQRLTTIRSAVELPGVVAELTSKRIAMFWKHSTEMAELSTKRGK